MWFNLPKKDYRLRGIPNFFYLVVEEEGGEEEELKGEANKNKEM